MSRAPTRAPNGKDRDLDALIARAASAPVAPLGAEPRALALPASAAQRCRFPFLEHFSARGLLEPKGKRMAAYEISLGLRLGIATGRTIALTVTPGTPARALAASFDELANALRAWADQCELEGQDPRDQPAAAKGPELCHTCELAPLHSCTRDACPQSRGSGAAQPAGAPPAPDPAQAPDETPPDGPGPRDPEPGPGRS